MSIIAEHKSKILHSTIAAFALFFIGCTGSEESPASLDESTVNISVTQSNDRTCSLEDSTRAGQGGPKRTFERMGQGGPKVNSPMLKFSTCGAVTVEAKGTCFDCDSVLFEIGSNEMVVDVSEDGTFKLLVSLVSLEGEIVLTPMDEVGSLGQAMLVDPASIEFLSTNVIIN